MNECRCDERLKTKAEPACEMRRKKFSKNSVSKKEK
jgi:hypothetical protein